MKKWLLMLPLTVLGLSLAACKEQVVEPEPIRPAQVWEVQGQMAEEVDTYSGEIKPRQVVDLSFRVAGKLLGRHAEIGDAITEGQALAQLDDEDSKLSVSQSQAGLQSSQMNLLAARDNYSATQGALASVQSNQVAAQGALTSARGNLAAIKASLETAQSAVDSAKATAASAQATVGVAEAEMQNAQQEFNRTNKLVQQGFAGKAVLDRDNQRLATAQANLKAAKANAAAAQAQVQSAVSRVKTSQAQVQAAEGEVASATANLGALAGQIKTAQAQAKAAQAQIGMAEAQVGNTEAQVKLVQNQSGYAVLKSTVTGVVTKTYAEVGQVMAAGQPVLSIARAGEFEVHIRVGEQAIKTIQPAMPVEISLWSDQGQKLNGSVREIAPVADENRTWLVKVEIHSAPPQLKLGMTAKVSFHKPLADKVAWLPATALFQQDKKPAIWVVAADGKVALQPVQVERYLDDGLWVSGLEANLKVVAAGVNRLHVGQQVMPVPYDGQAQPLTGKAAANGQ